MKKLPFYFLLLFFSSNAYAIFGPLRFSPTNPTAADVVRMSLQVGGCDTFRSTDREILVVGNVVKVTAIGISVTDFAQCNFPWRREPLY